jgi:hypothetical protein
MIYYIKYLILSVLIILLPLNKIIASNELLKSGDFLLSLDNLFLYSTGWGELNEDNKDKNSHKILFNSNLSLSMEYIFFKSFGAGISIENSTYLQGEFYDENITGSLSLYYYYIINKFAPYLAFSYYQMYNIEYSDCYIFKNYQYYSIKGGLLYKINNYFALNNSIEIIKERYKIVNQLSGHSIIFKLGFKIFIN